MQTFFAEKTTIDDLLHENAENDRQLFKIALAKYVDDIDNESSFKSVVRTFDLRTMASLAFILSMLTISAYFFNII